MNKTISIVGIIAVVALLVGFVAYNKTPSVLVGPQGPQGVQGPAGKDGINGRNGVDGVTRVVKETIEKPYNPVLGSQTGPDTYFPYIANNDVRTWSYSKKMAVATSTVCSIKAPTATSTLLIATVNFGLASSSVTVVDIAKSTSYAATTTKIGTTYNITAGSRAYIVASSTGSVAGEATLFGPNDYLNVKIGPTSGDGLGHAAIGFCRAEFVEI